MSIESDPGGLVNAVLNLPLDTLWKVTGTWGPTLTEVHPHPRTSNRLQPLNLGTLPRGAQSLRGREGSQERWIETAAVTD